MYVELIKCIFRKIKKFDDILSAVDHNVIIRILELLETILEDTDKPYSEKMRALNWLNREIELIDIAIMTTPSNFSINSIKPIIDKWKSSIVKSQLGRLDSKKPNIISAT